MAHMQTHIARNPGINQDSTGLQVLQDPKSQPPKPDTPDAKPNNSKPVIVQWQGLLGTSKKFPHNPTIILQL